MSTPEVILWAVALAVGFYARWRNLTACALVASFLFSQILYLATGDGLKVMYLAYPDVFVIMVIMAKPEDCSFEYRAGWFEELKCLIFERSPADRFILLTFPLVWWFYATKSGDALYWGLWIVAIAQFLAAGWEVFSKSRRRHAEAAESKPEYPGEMLVASGGRLGW